MQYLFHIAGLKDTVKQVKSSIDTITNIVKPVKDIIGELSSIQDAIRSELIRAKSVSLSHFHTCTSFNPTTLYTLASCYILALFSM